ncbi:MAG: hypothetical protein ABH800_01275 [Candidatus Nealsonbacteria bacterium]
MKKKKQNNKGNRFHESEIRPQLLFEQWKEILQKDISKQFPEEKLIKVSCPGCGSKKFTPAFMKLGLEYKRCSVCDSLFVSPRPQESDLRDFYNTSKSMNFWERKIMKASMNNRRRHQIIPLYEWFSYFVKDYQPKAKTALDYKPKYFSLLLFDKNFSKNLDKIIFVEPLTLKPEPFVKNIEVVDDIAKNGKVDILTAFEVLDREFNPINFVKKASKVCRKGGLFFLTTNTISGFEYQILGRNSSRLVPPDRLNLLSIEAIQKLLIKEGFQILDLSTPGKLDVELVVNTLQENPNIEMPEFLRYVFNRRDEYVWESFQDFLQLSRLSSYLRVAAIKK